MSTDCIEQKVYKLCFIYLIFNKMKHPKFISNWLFSMFFLCELLSCRFGDSSNSDANAKVWNQVCVCVCVCECGIVTLPSFFSVCGVSCHKDCCSRLAIECRKRVQSISCHNDVSFKATRSFSFPPPTSTESIAQYPGKRTLIHKCIEYKTHTHITVHYTIQYIEIHSRLYIYISSVTKL